MGTITVAKSTFKPKVFEYLRRVEQGDRICVTDHGQPVVDVIPHGGEDERLLRELRGLVRSYVEPMEPVDVDWEADS